MDGGNGGIGTMTGTLLLCVENFLSFIVFAFSFRQTLYLYIFIYMSNVSDFFIFVVIFIIKSK